MSMWSWDLGLKMVLFNAITSSLQSASYHEEAVASGIKISHFSLWCSAPFSVFPKVQWSGNKSGFATEGSGADLIQIPCSLVYTCQGSIHSRKDDSTHVNSPVYRWNDSHWGCAQAAESMHAFSQLIKARGITDDSMLLQNPPSSASLMPHTSVLQQEGACCYTLQSCSSDLWGSLSVLFTTGENCWDILGTYQPLCGKFQLYPAKGVQERPKRKCDKDSKVVPVPAKPHENVQTGSDCMKEKASLKSISLLLR